MTPDQLLVLVEHPVTQIVIGIAAISGAWYYLRHAREALKDPSAHTPKSLGKKFIWGNSLTLLAVLVAVVLVLVAYNWFTTGVFLRGS